MHMHFVSMFILGSGLGLFDAERDLPNLNWDSPVRRDTVSMFAGDPDGNDNAGEIGRDCGWLYVRVKFDSAGIIPFHCHVSAHMSMGMMTAFAVGKPDDLGPIPSDLPGFAGLGEGNLGYANAARQITLSLILVLMVLMW
jgi:laccase